MNCNSMAGSSVVIHPHPLQPRHFGRFEVRPTQRQLLVDGKVVTLGARSFDLLMAMLERPGQLLSKHDLLDAVWPGLVVEENNLSVQISALRKALGADVIVTTPGRGYRFAAMPVEPASAATPPWTGHPGDLRTNLPRQLQPLIGRDDDMAALASLLVEHRLITITGAGGMGKTRIAERMLHERLKAFEHGVAWVELAALSDPVLLPGTIAGALGLRIGSGDPLQALAVAMAPLQILVGLDNAEHLIDALASAIPVLLDGAPGLRLLVTSQMPLRVQRERVYRLAALAVPDADEPLEDALSYGAVRLFVERASAADRAFQVTAQTLPSVLRICAQLDGVALALELAAARVPMLGVAALAASLDDRLHLLTQGRRDVPARQRTLRAMLDWSHALLGPTEAVVFRRLSVFAGGFTLELARRVASDEAQVDPWNVLDALGGLVDRSLVSVEGGDAPRYRLLDTARVFAHERLVASGEEKGIRARHAQAVTQHFIQITAESLHGLRGVDEAVALLDDDLDNARVALAWFLAQGDASCAVALAPPLSFALTIARHAERSRLWEITTPLVTDRIPADLRAAWAAACSGHWYWGKPAIALQWARTAVMLYRQLGDERGTYRALSMLGMATARADLRVECEQACAELQACDERRFSARAQFMASVAFLGLADRRGDVDGMKEILRRQLVLAKAAGDTGNIQNALSTLVDTELIAGGVAEAVDHGIELERRLRGTRHQSSLAFARVGLTGALVASGKLEAARDMARLAWPLAVQFNIKFPLADNLAHLAALEDRAIHAALLLGYADAGNTAFGLVRQLAETHAARQAEALARSQLGEAEFVRLRLEGACLQDERALGVALSTSG